MSRTSKLTPIALLASAARVGTTKSSTDTAYGDAYRLADSVADMASIQAILFELDVTAAAADAGDKLDVAIQAMLDGTNYVDIVAFTQALGNGGAKRYYAKIAAGAAMTMFEAATALTAGSIRDVFGEWMRVKYALTNDSDATIDTSFTFGVTAMML